MMPISSFPGPTPSTISSLVRAGTTYNIVEDIFPMIDHAQQARFTTTTIRHPARQVRSGRLFWGTPFFPPDFHDSVRDRPAPPPPQHVKVVDSPPSILCIYFPSRAALYYLRSFEDPQLSLVFSFRNKNPIINPRHGMNKSLPRPHVPSWFVVRVQQRSKVSIFSL